MHVASDLSDPENQDQAMDTAGTVQHFFFPIETIEARSSLKNGFLNQCILIKI